MGLPNRTRDFTSATWAEMMESLSGPTEESREFRDFWNNYGSCFENLDLWNEAVMIDEFISQSRYLMSDLAPREFQRVYDRIHELDEAFGKDCENTVVELQVYGRGVEVLTEAISRKDFPASFSKTNLESNLFQIIMQSNPEKAAFLSNMKQQFGFDTVTAKLVWQAYESIQAKYGNESQKMRDWRFTRTMSALFYGPSHPQHPYWDYGAGPAFDGMEAKDYFISVLGFDSEDFEYLWYKVRIQNAISSNQAVYTPDEIEELSDSDPGKFSRWKSYMAIGLGMANLSDDEFMELMQKQYESFGSVTDFAHMQYVLAAQLVDDDLAEEQASVGLITIWRNHDERRMMTGWLGDAVLVGGIDSPPSFGPEDYKADIDAANIAYYMQNTNLNGVQPSYLNAFNQYCNKMKQNNFSRASEFLEYTSMENVLFQIDVNAAYVESEMCERAVFLEMINWLDTKRFIESLEAEANEMVN